MPTYKDFDEIRKEIEAGKKNLHFKSAENAEICAGVLAFVQGVIDRVPEADVEPVKHGRWLINSDGYYPYCSECKREPDGRKMSKHCPHCGAKMDGKKVQEMSEYPKVIRVLACNPIEGYEYIARETALEIIDNYAKTVTEDGLVVVNAIKDIINVICPTAPVKPVVTCKDCKYNGLHTCPIAYIEKQTLQFVNYDPDFWCANGELKMDGKEVQE